MGFCFLQKAWVRIKAVNMVKNFLILQKKSTIDAIKTASKRAIQKRAKATGDLIGNKIANKIKNISKKSLKVHSKSSEVNDESEIP